MSLGIPNCGNYSTRQYVLKQAESAVWETFADPMRSSAQWGSGWFSVSRRFLLYGGGKEFNANFEASVDRVIDYVTALESAIVPESDLVSRRLRKRVQRLLDLAGKGDSSAERRINDMYGVRSTLVHGSRLSNEQMNSLRDKDNWWRFEELVREVLLEALRRVPADESQRRAYLASLYDVTDKERADQVRQNYKAINNDSVRRALIEELGSGFKNP